MDDQPIWMRTRAGPFLSVPYPQEVNDIPSVVARTDTADTFAAMILDDFEERLAQSREQSLVMGIALHPYIVGQPYRLRALRRVLERIAGAREEVWITRAGDIAAECHGRLRDMIA
jgi:hypothetical protein